MCCLRVLIYLFDAYSTYLVFFFNYSSPCDFNFFLFLNFVSKLSHRISRQSCHCRKDFLLFRIFGQRLRRHRILPHLLLTLNRLLLSNCSRSLLLLHCLFRLPQCLQSPLFGNFGPQCVLFQNGLLIRIQLPLRFSFKTRDKACILLNSWL